VGAKKKNGFPKNRMSGLAPCAVVVKGTRCRGKGSGRKKKVGLHYQKKELPNHEKETGGGGGGGTVLILRLFDSLGRPSGLQGEGKKTDSLGGGGKLSGTLGGREKAMPYKRGLGTLESLKKKADQI